MAATLVQRSRPKADRRGSDSDSDDDPVLPAGHVRLPGNLGSLAPRRPPTGSSRAASRPRPAPHLERAFSLPTDYSASSPAPSPSASRNSGVGITPDGDFYTVPASAIRPLHASRCNSLQGDDGESDGSRSRCSSMSIVDGLLFDIYDRWHFSRRDSFDSDTFTEYSSTSDAFHGRLDSFQLECEQKHSNRLTRSALENKDAVELSQLRADLQHRVTQTSTRLVRQLRTRNRRLLKVRRHCDILTAILQASSLKRRIDSKIRFSIEPLPGEDAFLQWKDAMRAVGRLPLGIPSEFRKKVWLALADNHISHSLKIDWENTKRFAFNERSNPDDNKLGLQIVKDLHRTGCSGFSGSDNEEERAVLKRVLLAYARWNKRVGYCQGFNVLAALILDVMDRREGDALKVMIFLVDHVLPESYFANNLRALSVDMAVFRDLLQIELPQLSAHLDRLQAAARDHNTGANYEPPLTNVFTMQWFLTLFATCLPKPTALRVWDSVLLDGSEILLRTAVAIWGRLQDRIMNVQSADEFYSTMGMLTQEMLDSAIIEPDQLIKTIYGMGPLPLPKLSELREKYTYDITPFSAAMETGSRPGNKGGANIFSDEDDLDEDDLMDNINCFTGIFPPQLPSPSKAKHLGDQDRMISGSSYDISKASPGAYAAQPEELALHTADSERRTLDLSMLNHQYKRLRQRQKQAHIILAVASAKHKAKVKTMMPVAPIESPMAVNHLFIGRRHGINPNKQNKTVTDAPQIAPMYLQSSLMTAPYRPHGHWAQASQQQRHQGRSHDTKRHAHLTPANMPIRSPSSDSRESSSTVMAGDSTDCSIDPDSDLDSGSLIGGQDTADEVNLIELEGEKRTCLEVIGLEEVENGESDGVVDIQDSVTVVRQDTETSVPKEEDAIGDDSGIQVDRVDSKVKKTLNFEENQVITSGSGFNTPHTLPKTQVANISPDGKPLTLLQIATGEVGKVSENTPPVTMQTHIAKGTHKNGSKPPSPGSSDASTDYVAALTYKSHRLKHTKAGSICSLLSDDEDVFLQDEQGAKVFNPFPSQHFNQRRTQNGIKLGLYSANNVPRLETGMTKSGNIPGINRSHINSCLHRQYMAELRQQAKSSKR